MFFGRSTNIRPQDISRIRLANTIKRFLKKVEDLDIDKSKLEERAKMRTEANYIAIDHKDGSFSLAERYSNEDIHEIYQALKQNNFLRSDLFVSNENNQ